MYYPCSENKGADQLRGYREADLRLCFRLGKNPVFSRCGSFFLFINAPVICIPGTRRAGDSGDIAGLKCRDLISDVSRQCRGKARVLISRQHMVTLIQISLLLSTRRLL